MIRTNSSAASGEGKGLLKKVLAHLKREKPIPWKKTATFLTALKNMQISEDLNSVFSERGRVSKYTNINWKAILRLSLQFLFTTSSYQRKICQTWAIINLKT